MESQHHIVHKRGSTKLNQGLYTFLRHMSLLYTYDVPGADTSWVIDMMIIFPEINK